MLLNTWMLNTCHCRSDELLKAATVVVVKALYKILFMNRSNIFWGCLVFALRACTRCKHAALCKDRAWSNVSIPCLCTIVRVIRCANNHNWNIRHQLQSRCRDIHCSHWVQHTHEQTGFVREQKEKQKTKQKFQITSRSRITEST